MRAELESLAIVDDHPAMNRDWSATFRALASSPAASTLRVLRLEHLPQASAHMLALVPMAPRCYELDLPFLDPNDPQKWRLWVFARLCDSLQYLNVRGFQGDAINVLLAFPTGPPCLYIEELVGTVGYGHPLVDESVIPVKDAIHALISVLLQRALSGQPVRHLAIGSRRNMSDRHQVNLMGLVGSAGLYRLELCERDEYLTQEEVSPRSRPIPATRRHADDVGDSATSSRDTSRTASARIGSVGLKPCANLRWSSE